jgi:hypothetical protein
VPDEGPKVPGPAAPRIMAQIVVAITDGGQVVVRGAIDDVVLAYGLLEAGKDAIREHHAAAHRSPLLLPPAARMGRRAGPPAQDDSAPGEQDKPADK